MLHAHRFDPGSSSDRLRDVMNVHVEKAILVIFEDMAAPSARVPILILRPSKVAISASPLLDRNVTAQ